MESLADWALSLCATGVAVFLCEILLPDGNIAKIFKIAASVFFLSAILSPLLSGLGAGEFSGLGGTDYAPSDTAQRAVESAVISGFRSNLESELLAGLQRAGIPASGVEAKVSLKEDGVTLAVDSVTVRLPNAEAADPAAVTKAVLELSGVEPEIFYEEEDHGLAEKIPQ
ncbi:MAG TPA: stage III sporulation protein AF [Oscillospiraceae bacterium]|nr:stage III sporulation protein AF [Oscillospiraceae bacterium]HNW04730.1 stage III sporulation protein AF [Oscillospiraceae bacterium]HPV99786.1 stage III sporulation protein AF [Oscillospiraceae bacterium]